MWLAALALAWADPHLNIVVEAGIEVPLGDRGAGVRLGAGMPFLVGNPCTYWERTDCRSSMFWPATGPRLGARWSARDSLTAELGGAVSVMHAEVFTNGWFPLWELEARAHAELGARGVTLVLAGIGGRALAYRDRTTPGGSYRTYGPEFLSLRVGGQWRPLGAERVPTLLFAGAMPLVASDLD